MKTVNQRRSATGLFVFVGAVLLFFVMRHREENTVDVSREVMKDVVAASESKSRTDPINHAEIVEGVDDPVDLEAERVRYRKSLMLDEDGQLVSIDEFELRLNLDDTFNFSGRDFEKRLFLAYVKAGLEADPEKMVAFLRENMERLAADSDTYADVIHSLADALGFDAAASFMQPPISRKFIDNAFQRMNTTVLFSKPMEYLAFMQANHPERLASGQIYANVLAVADLSYDEKLGLFKGIEGAASRVDALNVLISEISELEDAEFVSAYQMLSEDLRTTDERFALSHQLISGLDSVTSPKAQLLFEDAALVDPNVLSELGERLAGQSTEQALADIERDHLNEDEKNWLLSGITKVWAEYAPADAVNHAFSHYMTSESKSYEPITSAYQTWLMRDTESALEHVNELGIDRVERKFIDSYTFANVANVSTEMAQDYVAGLDEEDPEGNLTDYLRSEMVNSTQLSYDYEHIMEEVGEIKDPQMRYDSYHKLSIRMAGRNMADEVVELAASQRDPDIRDALLTGAMYEFQQMDLGYALDLAGEISNPQRRNDAYRDLYVNLRQQEPLVAESWVEGLKETNRELYELFKQ